MNQRVLVLLAILTAGAALRIHLDSVREFSSDDETVYLHFTQYLVAHGWGAYPQMTRAYLADQRAHFYPDPLRWSYLALTTSASAIEGHCGFDVLADVSTLAGIFSILFTFLLGKELLGWPGGLLSAALTVLSPLQLALGRRALQDEVLCAASTLTIWLLVRATRGEGSARFYFQLAAAAALTFTLGIKESFPFYFLPIVVLLFLLADAGRRWQQLLPVIVVLVAAVLANVVIFSLLTRSAFAYGEVWRAATSTLQGLWAVQYQSGPIHRPLIDFFLLSPMVMILAIAGAARADGQSPVLALSAFVIMGLLLFGLFSSKNVRYAIGLEPAIRLLAASLILRLPRRPLLPLGILILVGWGEWSVFSRVFMKAEVFDPTSNEILQALHFIPWSEG